MWWKTIGTQKHMNKFHKDNVEWKKWYDSIPINVKKKQNECMAREFSTVVPLGEEAVTERDPRKFLGMFSFLIWVPVTWVCSFYKNSWIVFLRLMHFSICILHCNKKSILKNKRNGTNVYKWPWNAWKKMNQETERWRYAMIQQAEI